MGSKRDIGLKVAAIVAVVFGVMTVVSGGRALFADIDMGAVVPFVLWFNFLAGFAYVAAGLGLLKRCRWAVWLSLAILASTFFVMLAFGAHLLGGGAYEARTVVAITARTVVWAVISAVAFRKVGRRWPA